MMYSESLNYLRTLPPEYPMILVSFFATNPEAIHKLENQWAQRDPAHRIYLGRDEQETKKVTSADLGGAICLVDPLNLDKGFLYEIDCPVATGLCYHKATKTLYVGSNKWIRLIQKGQVVGTVGNSLFNDVHALTATLDNRLLIAATGTDSLLELDFTDTTKLSWDWIATEHGYNKTPKGDTRVIDKSINFQEIGTNTTQHTTHINSGLNYAPNKILATLFHQGTLIQIDKTTKSHKIVYEGLQSPHSIRTKTDGFIVSDTRNNRVVLLDTAFKMQQCIEFGFNWVQDCIEIKPNLFLVADSNNNRLISITKQNKVETMYDIPKGTKKVSTFLAITCGEAQEILYEQ